MELEALLSEAMDKIDHHEQKYVADMNEVTK